MTLNLHLSLPAAGRFEFVLEFAPKIPTFVQTIRKMNTKNLLFLFAFLFFSISTFAQANQKPALNLETPRNSMYVHLYYLQEDSYQPDSAAVSLATDLPKEKKNQRAIQLKQILDGKGLYVYFSQIPDEANFMDSISGTFTFTPFPEELPEVFLVKQAGQWKYASQTVDQLPALHAKLYPLGSNFFVKLFPRIGNRKIAGLKLWQITGFALLILFTWLAHFLLRVILNPIVKYLGKSKKYTNLVSPHLTKRIANLLSVFLLIRLLGTLFPALMLPVKLTELCITIINIISIIIVVIIALRVADIFIEYMERLAKKTTNKMDEQVVPIVKKGIQILIVLAGAIQMLSLLNVNITALIAGVSIGGLALALAAQDTVKNLIGSAMIFVDQPFQIGDWINAGGQEGAVEEVGFRTTRIKTADSAIISVPNGTIANQAINNMGMREYRLMKTMLGLKYDTSLDKIKAYIDALRQMIEEHKSVDHNASYIHLNNLGASSIDILFRVKINVNDYKNELIAKEDLLFKVLKTAEEIGVDFAFPSSSIYIEGNNTVDS